MRAGIAWAGVVLIAACGLAIMLTGGAPWRMSLHDRMVLSVAGDQQKHHHECMTIDDVWVDPARACTLGQAGATPETLLWGDSHAMVTATAMETAARARHAAFLFAADADCPIGLGFDIDPAFAPAVTAEGHYRRCADYNRAMLDVALQPRIRTVVLSSRWTNWRLGEPANPAEGEVDIRLRTSTGTATSKAANRAIFERGFASLIDTLSQAGKRVVIVGPLPEPRFDVPHRTYINRFGLAEPVLPLTMADYARRHAVILRYFASMTQNAQFIWPSDALCHHGICPVLKAGVPLYFDQDHLSVAAAQSTAPLYESVFG
jgi:hypothetical protein